MLALGLSKKKIDELSNLVRGLEPRLGSPPRMCGYKHKRSQYAICIAFWRYFFGEQTQTSGDGKRYYPCNLSAFYLFHNHFWPWWKDHCGEWSDQVSDLPPTANPHLLPVPVTESQCMSAESALHMFRMFCSEETKVDDNEEWDSHQLSDELQDLLDEDEELDQGMVEDFTWEHEANLARKELQREAGLPSFSTFMRARYDPEFKDVKRREKHFHCRCPTHADLRSKMLQARRDPEKRMQLNELLKAHHSEVKHWRLLETSRHLLADSDPHLEILLSLDDTSPMGFPRMTNRPIKSVPNDRVYMTPFNLTNHGTGENIYIYDFKHKWRHGADRLCTNLYFVLARIKFKDPAHCTRNERAQRLTRKLTIMADNCPENKNNTLFQFLAELIMRNWFDEIELLFGPVGHTHNGNDAVHYIHNQIAGNYCSITPAELFQNYKHAWHKERSRPQPIIMESQFAWTERYRPKASPVVGFTNTPDSPNYVRAFWFSLVAGSGGENNDIRQVEMKIKGSPSAPTWYGVDSVPNAPGFQVLTGLPDGFPLPKKPLGYQIPKEFLTRLKGKKVEAYCKSEGRAAMFPNFVQMAETLTVPSLGPITPSQWEALPEFRRWSMSGYGSVELIGVRGCVTYFVPFIRDRPTHQTEQSFWALPGDEVSRAGLPTPCPASVPLDVPMVRYASQARQDKARAREKSIRPKRSNKKRTTRKRKQNLSSSEEEEQEEEEAKRAPARRTKRHRATKRLPMRSQSVLSDEDSEEKARETKTRRRRRPVKKNNQASDESDEAGSQPDMSMSQPDMSQPDNDDWSQSDWSSQPAESQPAESEEDSGSAVPDDWGASMENCHVGTFAVVQAEYDDGKTGISLSKVCDVEFG